MTDIEQDLDRLVQQFSAGVTKERWLVYRDYVAKAISELKRCGPVFQHIVEQLEDLQGWYNDKCTDGGFKLDVAMAVAAVMQRRDLTVTATADGDYANTLRDIYARLDISGDEQKYVLQAVRIEKMAAAIKEGPVTALFDPR